MKKLDNTRWRVFYEKRRKGCDELGETQNKKHLQNMYRERDIVGGVYAIRNTLNNKVFLEAVPDLRGIQNRFEFAQKTGSCIHVKLQNDWDSHGGGQFVFEVLEELKKGDAQTDGDFKADLVLLKEMWLENMSDKEFY